MQGSGRSRFRHASTAAVLAFSALAAAGCASHGAGEGSSRKRSKEYFAESEYGVKASPRVSWGKSNLPRGGGRDQTGKPYAVRGKWYYPKEEKNYRKVGAASWYGDAFHGRLTANGEIYDMTHLTAAHPTMPLPSYARVTNMANGSSVIVRVNDRGPYSDGRIIDLSHRAAELLDYSHVGVAKVKVEYVGRAPLDGKDDRFLMASYRPGRGAPDPSDGLPSGVMIAMNGSQPTGRAPSAVPFPQSPPPPLDPAVTASAGILALPALVPIVPQRPAADTQVGFATLGYAPIQGAGTPAALAAIDGVTGSEAASYVAAGTFARRSDAQSLADRLSPYGEARVTTEGRNAFSVSLRSDGTLSGDELLEAAWANGAPEAMTVRE